MSDFDAIKQQVNGVKIIRATSPINGKTVWMEFFSPDVSKANGVKWLCDKLKIPVTLTLGVGNDYNDLDLLGFTSYSYIVDNAPDELKNKFSATAGNMESGFSKAVAMHFDLN